MNKKPISEYTPQADMPYDVNDEATVQAFWDEAIEHRGVEEFRAKRGRPKKGENECKEQIALRIDADVLAWYRSLGAGWQTKMNAVLKAYRDTQIHNL